MSTTGEKEQAEAIRFQVAALNDRLKHVAQSHGSKIEVDVDEAMTEDHQVVPKIIIKIWSPL